jgi:two-component sensor histidine kinase
MADDVNAFTDLAGEVAARDHQIHLLREAHLRIVDENKTLASQLNQQLNAKQGAQRRAEAAEKALQELERKYVALKVHADALVDKLRSLGIG